MFEDSNAGFDREVGCDVGTEEGFVLWSVHSSQASSSSVCVLEVNQSGAKKNIFEASSLRHLVILVKADDHLTRFLVGAEMKESVEIFM